MMSRPHKSATRPKHDALREVANKLGGQAALGRALGIVPNEIGRWINLQDCPPTTVEEAEERKWSKEKYLRIEKKLYELTGQLMEDLFPKKPQNIKKTNNTKYIHSHLLAGYGQERFVLPSPCDEIKVDKNELRENIKNSLNTLNYRERQTLKLRFGLEDGNCYTLEEIAYIFGVTQERVRQIEMRAIRKMQQPIRSQELFPFLEGASPSESQTWPTVITYLDKIFVGSGKREMNTALQSLAAKYINGEEEVWLQADGKITNHLRTC
jgi:RNA polymerase sigma factor (sigma-70 family)